MVIVTIIVSETEPCLNHLPKPDFFVFWLFNVFKAFNALTVTLKKLYLWS